MIVDFDKIEEKKIPEFKGGEGHLLTLKYPRLKFGLLYRFCLVELPYCEAMGKWLRNAKTKGAVTKMNLAL